MMRFTLKADFGTTVVTWKVADFRNLAAAFNTF
jgi:hypothetical protein